MNYSMKMVSGQQLGYMWKFSPRNRTAENKISRGRNILLCTWVLGAEFPGQRTGWDSLPRGSGVSEVDLATKFGLVCFASFSGSTGRNRIKIFCFRFCQVLLLCMVTREESAPVIL